MTPFTVELAELSARGEVLAPLIEVGSVLAQAARPKPINQDAHTVAAAPVVRRRA
jgi:hypothetical protein